MTGCKEIHSPTILHFLDNKFIPNHEYFNAILNNNYSFASTKVIMFIDHGYDLTYDQLLDTIHHKVKNNSIDRLNFNFDDAFVKTCVEQIFILILTK